MQHSIHTAARQRRKQSIRKLGRAGRWAAAVAAVSVGGLTTFVGYQAVGAADVRGPGAVIASGDAGYFGAATGNAVTGMARTPSGDGYWVTSNRGAVFAFGDAAFHGSLPPGASSDIVDIASTPDGGGYWVVAGDGSVHGFGSAPDLGSVAGTPLNQPIVGMAATPSGLGYWLVAGDGGVFAFGDAALVHAPGALTLKQPIVGIAATPTGLGYWLVARDGGIFTAGDAEFKGSAASLRLVEPIVGIASTPSGEGYWVVARDGGVFTYGDARFHGSLAGTGSGPVVDIDATATGAGHWVTTGGRYLGDFELTCYSLRGTTASGKPVGRQGVAVDPRVIKLGSEIYIGGEGTRSAIDTGGAIKGNRIDIWRPSTAECRNFGRKTVPVFSLS